MIKVTSGVVDWMDWKVEGKEPDRKQWDREIEGVKEIQIKNKIKSRKERKRVQWELVRFNTSVYLLDKARRKDEKQSARGQKAEPWLPMSKA